MAKPRPFLVCVCFLTIFDVARAQQPPDQGNPPTQPGNQPGQQQQQGSQKMPEMERPIYLSGRVMYDDGAPADTTVQVEMVCNGRVRRQVYAFGGGFSLEVTQTNRRLTVMDAGVASQDITGSINNESEDALARMMVAGGQNPGEARSSGTGYVNLMGCELRAVEPGFESDIIPLSFVRPLDNPDVGVIVLHRSGSITGTTTSVVSMAAPKKAKQAYQRALKEVRKPGPDHQKVAAELKKATDLYSEYAAAWELLGQIRLAESDEPGARQAFELAAAGDPKYIRPGLAMMELEVRKENWEEVSMWSSRVTELNPYLVVAQYYCGVANTKLNRFEPAQQSFQKVRQHYRGDDYPYASYMLGYILANQGEFESAATELRHFLKIKEQAEEADQIKTHLAQWEREGHIKPDKN